MTPARTSIGKTDKVEEDGCRIMRRNGGTRTRRMAENLTAALGFVSFSKPELAKKPLFCNAPRRLERAIRESARTKPTRFAALPALSAEAAAAVQFDLYEVSATGSWCRNLAERVGDFNRPFNSGMAKLSKIEAARRPLDCVIRLHFDNDDLLAVHAIVTSLGVHLA